jgi:Spy/CpxP family protein refolding chaperone
MSKRLIIGLMIIALAIAASMVINAAPRGGGMGGMAPGAMQKGPGGGCPLGMGMGFGMMAKELNLSDSQVKDLKQRYEDFMTTTKPMREEMKAKVKEMVDLWMVDQPDASAIKALAGEIDGLKAQIRDAGIDHMVSALSVLTPAQREKLHTIIKAHAAKCGCMGCGMCMGPGMGCGMMGPGAGGRGMGGGMGRGCPMAK